MKLRSFFSVTLAILISLVIATTALAVSIRPNFTWLQGTNPTCTSGTFNQSGSQMTFEGVATSPSVGTFKAELQVQGLFGGWSQVNNTYVYTVNQNSNTTYDVTTGQNVQGQFFKLYWPNPGSGNYRVMLRNPSAPQATVFSQVRY